VRTRILEGDDLWLLADVPGPFEGQRDVIAQLGNAQVVAVEDPTTGQILGYWPIWVAVHLEPLWVQPAARRNPAVIKALVMGMRAQLAAERITTAFATIAHVDLTANLPMAARMGFERVPGDLFFVKLADVAEAGTDGSSSDPGNLPGRPVLHEPGEKQEDRRGARRLDEGPPDLE
jgi:hypothetical protein